MENKTKEMERETMENKEKEFDNLPKREVDILYVMWKAGKPVLASEIAEKGEDLKLATVHTTLKRMLKKNLIEVADFAKSGNVFGRCYQPTISLKDFELSRLSCNFKDKQCGEITASHLVAALLDDEEKEVALVELDELEKMIHEKREKILKKS